MDLTGTHLVCCVCEAPIEEHQPFKVFSGALCSESEKPHPKSKILRPVRSTQKYLSVTVCGKEECGSTAIGRIWRGV